MKRLIILISCLLNLSYILPLTPFYIQKGSYIYRDENNDPKQINAIEWQVRLYKKDSPKNGNSYWGIIKGRTADEVLTKLKSDQDFELKFNKFIGKGYIEDDVFTHFNPLGPIAIIEESKLEESSNESNYDKLLEVIEKAKDYYDDYSEVYKILKAEPIGPYDNFGNVFKDYTENLKLVFKNVDKLKNVLFDNTDNKLGQINSDISKIDNGYQTLDKIRANLKEHNLSESKFKNKNKGSLNSFYVFFVVNIKVDPIPSQFSNLQSPKTLFVVSAPIIHNGLVTDPLLTEKESFISKLEKQFADKPEILNKLLKNMDNNPIEVHYGKPYSTLVLKTKEDGFEAIEEYEQSIKEAIEGLPNANMIEFYNLN